MTNKTKPLFFSGPAQDQLTGVGVHAPDLRRGLVPGDHPDRPGGPGKQLCQIRRCQGSWSARVGERDGERCQ